MQWVKSLCVTACLLSAIQTAQAGVIVGGTRVIYDSAKKEASLSIKNPEKNTPYLIQSWADNQQASDNSKVPFIITPPLFRLDAGQENILRIVRAGGNLPEDRESVFWLNVKSIPSSVKSEQNQLQITVKTRIKLFFRPAGLSGNSAEAYKALTFSRQGNQLKANNPTPYFVSFQHLSVGGKEIKEAGMIAPMSQKNWTLPVGGNGNVIWQAINDYGGISPQAKANL